MCRNVETSRTTYRYNLDRFLVLLFDNVLGDPILEGGYSRVHVWEADSAWSDERCQTDLKIVRDEWTTWITLKETLVGNIVSAISMYCHLYYQTIEQLRRRLTRFIIRIIVSSRLIEEIVSTHVTCSLTISRERANVALPYVPEYKSTFRLRIDIQIDLLKFIRFFALKLKESASFTFMLKLQTIRNNLGYWQGILPTVLLTFVYRANVRGDCVCETTIASNRRFLPSIFPIQSGSRIHRLQ